MPAALEALEASAGGSAATLQHTAGPAPSLPPTPPDPRPSAK